MPRQLAIASLTTLLLLPVTVFGEPEISSKAEKITITGRVQTQWRHTTMEGEISNRFLMRRVRATVKLKINDWIDGVVQPDYGDGKVALKDAYMLFKFNKNFSAITGQFYRPFDLFELTSSTKILVIERDGRIGDVKVPSLSSLVEGLGFGDRDIGAMVEATDSNGRIKAAVAVTNGDGANASASQGEKAYQGRVTLKPIDDRDLQISGGVSAKPYQGMDPDKVEYAAAFEGSVEWGNFTEGPHVQAGFVGGDNWEGDFTMFDPLTESNVPKFWAVQGIATYKHLLQSNGRIESIEPLVRVSFADPNTDVTDDGGVVVTPGVNVFFTTRNRLALNVDVFLPQDSNVDTEASIKAQSWLYW